MARLKYSNGNLGELAMQLAMSPHHLRHKQLDGIDRLLEMVVPTKSYPYDLVCFHITGTRPQNSKERPGVTGTQLLVAEMVGRHRRLDRCADYQRIRAS